MHNFTPRGVCSRAIHLELDGERVAHVDFVGGCDGNLKGIRSLVRGQKAQDVIARVRGIHCGSKPTSCPDQLAYALQAYLNQR